MMLVAVVIGVLLMGSNASAEKSLGERLYDAAKDNNVPLCEKLIEEGADVNWKDTWGETPLHWAAARGHQDVCATLLKHGADVNVRDNSGWTPLHTAAARGHQDACATLLKHGAHVNVRDKVEGYTALMWTVKYADIPLTELLLQWGSNVTIEAYDGNTAWTLANEDEQTVLEEAYCKPLKLPENGQTDALTTKPGSKIYITCPYGGSIETYSLLCQLNRTWDSRPLCNPDGCVNGRYGANCTSICGHCGNNSICDQIYGRCPSGCEAGYMGFTCDQGCVNGSYGVNCASRCGHCGNNALCNKSSGRCPSGCEAGYFGFTCDQVCVNGRYGADCASMCGHCENNALCNKSSGRCPSGCEAGYIRFTCDQACVNGRYGANCISMCGHCGHNDTCDKISGRCPSSCEAGYYGLRCFIECGNCASGHTCDSETGECADGCAFDYHGDKCDQYKWIIWLIVIIVIIVIIIGLGCVAFIVCAIAHKHKHRKNPQQNNETIEMQVPPIEEENKLNFLSILKEMKLELYDSVINHQLDNERVNVGRNILGQGNFGIVYKGTYNSAEGQKPIAVKTLKGSNPSPRDYSEFIEEATMMMEFQHENVLSIYGVMIKENRPYVILPFMENGDLHSYLVKTSNQIKLDEMLGYGLQISKGMNYLSHLKFIHRDLAARNCMISHNHLVKIADFGLARDIYEKDYYRSDDATGPLPRKWLAIETLKKHIFSTKTDVWAYGVTLWEILMKGTPPYPDIDNIDIKRYLEAERRMDQPQDCPDRVYTIMRNCWQTDPEARPTFQAIQENLADIIANCTTREGSTGAMNVKVKEDEYLDPVNILPSEWNRGRMPVEIHNAEDEYLDPVNILPSEWNRGRMPVEIHNAEDEYLDPVNILPNEWNRGRMPVEIHNAEDEYLDPVNILPSEWNRGRMPVEIHNAEDEYLDPVNILPSEWNRGRMPVEIHNAEDKYLDPVNILPSEWNRGRMPVEIHNAEDKYLDPVNILPSEWNRGRIHDPRDEKVTVIGSESELSDVLFHESACADTDNLVPLIIQSPSQVTTNPAIPLLVTVPVAFEQSE